MKPIISFVFITTLCAAAGPLSGQPAPLYAVPGTFQARADGAEASVEILDEQGREIARYDLSGCRFTRDAREILGGDGVFALIFPGAAEPMVAAICHPDEGGQRFSIFAPARHTRRPILEVSGDSFVGFAIHPGFLVLSHDTGGHTVEELWHPGIEGNASDIDEVRRLMAAAAGRRFADPEPVDDADFRALGEGLAQIAASRDTEALAAMAAPHILLSFGGNAGVEEFRALISEPWFWPEFERVLDGGGVVLPGREGGRVAFFPAMFRTWPVDLDAYEHFYGDRPGARLRAGPSDNAPAIADLHRRIVARGPYLGAEPKLYEDGWVHLCTRAEGCGFAREQHVRSPIDWRAIFTQIGKGAPWVLETYVAGD